MAKPESPSEPFKLEQFLGAKLFAWVGGIALFFGVAFFIKYSFDRNLIPPGMRVLLGAATGIGLIVGGIRLRHRPLFHATAHTLCASGILILYAAAFGAYQLYSLITLRDAFGLMSLITAGAFIMSVKFDSKPAAVLALLGGFLTPLLLRSCVYLSLNNWRFISSPVMSKKTAINISWIILLLLWL